METSRNINSDPGAQGQYQRCTNRLFCVTTITSFIKNPLHFNRCNFNTHAHVNMARFKTENKDKAKNKSKELDKKIDMSLGRYFLIFSFANFMPELAILHVKYIIQYIFT